MCADAAARFPRSSTSGAEAADVERLLARVLREAADDRGHGQTGLRARRPRARARAHGTRLGGEGHRRQLARHRRRGRGGRAPRPERMRRCSRRRRPTRSRATSSPPRPGATGWAYALTAPAIRGQLWSGWRPDRVLLVADPRAALDRSRRTRGRARRFRRTTTCPSRGRACRRSGGPSADRRADRDDAFGQAQVEDLLGRPVALVPHGVSTPFYRSPRDRPGSWKGEPVTSKAGAKEALDDGRTVLLRTDGSCRARTRRRCCGR